MFTLLHKIASMLLGLLPTLFTLALLGGVAWWGYIWDWKVPTLPELLNSSAAKKDGDQEKKSEDERPKSTDNSLPTINLPSEEKVKESGIRTGQVQQRQINDYVQAHGHIDFDQTHYAHLATRASGTAWRVFKQAGDEVKKGEVLALIASPELANLKFELQQTLLTVKAKKAYHQRLQKGGETTIKKELEIAEFAWRDARLALSKYQQSLQNLGLNVSLDGLATLSDEQVTAKLRTLGIPDTLLQGLDDSQLTNNLLPMYAPFDGVVITRDIVKGEMVTPAKPQFHLADLSQLWICLHVRLENVGRLKIGQPVEFHLDGPNEDAPPAQIKWISAEVEEKTRTVTVRADVANPQGCLRPGTFGDARIIVGRQKRLLVPTAALQFDVDRKEHFVFVRGESPTEYLPRRVQLGPQDNKDTVVLEGIEAGQTIAVSGTHVLLSEMQRERIAGDD